MRLIHTAELAGANPFDYLTENQKHAAELRRDPASWMPWNYRATIEAGGGGRRTRGAATVTALRAGTTIRRETLDGTPRAA